MRCVLSLSQFYRWANWEVKKLTWGHTGRKRQSWTLISSGLPEPLLLYSPVSLNANFDISIGPKGNIFLRPSWGWRNLDRPTSIRIHIAADNTSWRLWLPTDVYLFPFVQVSSWPPSKIQTPISPQVEILFYSYTKLLFPVSFVLSFCLSHRF